LQLTHYNNNFKKHTFPIILICDNITHAANIGSLFRTADAFGVEKIIFCGEEINIGKKVLKTSRSTEKAINYEINKEIQNVTNQVKNSGYKLIAIEITDNSISIDSISFNNNAPTALIIGDENFGISESILNTCDSVLHVEMHGQNSSMNVVQATTIALYEITKQFKQNILS